MKTKNSLITSRQMRALETNAEYYGISLLQLMENAGCNIAKETILRFPKGKNVAIFCGLGGNGGDGFVAARHLLAAGYNVSVVLVGRSRDISHEAALKNWVILESMQGKVVLTEVMDSSVIPKVSADVIIMPCLERELKAELSRQYPR